MRFAAARLTDFTVNVLIAAGVEAAEATRLAGIMVWSDCVGRRNHGVKRLPIITERLSRDLFQSPFQPEFQQTSTATGVLNGNNGLGHLVAFEGMNHAIELARQAGIGVVAVYDSNFFGAGAYYVQQAAECDMIGVAMSNSPPIVAAHGGVKPVLGTNPFAFGAPRRNGRNMLLDMATSASAGSFIRQYAEEGKALPEGIAIDNRGRPLSNPAELSRGAILPFGGPKGWGLMLMVETLAGVLTGAGIGPGVKSMYKDFGDSGHNGHFFMAIDIERFLPLETWYERMEEMIALVCSSADNVSGQKVRIPGEVRWEALERSNREGIYLDDSTIAALSILAHDYDVIFKMP